MENKKQVSIYSLEASAKKISDGLDVLLDIKPRMYEKTKVRYNNITASLLSSVEKISRILQDSALTSQSDDEFNELASAGFDPNVEHALRDATRGVEEVQSFSSGKLQKDSIDLHLIDNVFEEAGKVEFGWKEVNQCAELLYSWFHFRFIQYPVTSCNYSYLGQWVHKFILTFGRFCANSGKTNFEASLISWCDRLKVKDTWYALPHFIFEALKSTEPTDYNLESVLINDMLYSRCLYKLSEVYPMFDSMELCRVVKKHNPALLPTINTRFAKQDELLMSVGFTPSKGGI